MNPNYRKEKQLHFELTNVGLRAQATAVGLMQLCIELQQSGALDQMAIERIKGAIADDVSLAAPRGISPREYRSDIKARLDRLFAGEQEVGSADALAFQTTEV